MSDFIEFKLLKTNEADIAMAYEIYSTCGWYGYKDVILRESYGSKIFFILLGGKPVGCISEYPIIGRLRKSIELLRLCILPEYRRLGLASGVLEGLSIWLHSSMRADAILAKAPQGSLMAYILVKSGYYKLNINQGVELYEKRF